MSTKNLGWVAAVKAGTVAPANTKMLWYHTTEKKFKVYDSDDEVWVDLEISVINILKQVGTVLNSLSFPLLSEVGIGDIYKATADCVDNYAGDPARTNTGQSFFKGDLFYWNGSIWEMISRTRLVEIFSATNTAYEQNGNFRIMEDGGSLVIEKKESGNWNKIWEIN